MDPVATTSATKTNGESTLRDLFALTDEQILEIEPEAQDVDVARDPWPVTREEKPEGQARASNGTTPNGPENVAASEKPNIDSRTAANGSSTGHGSRSTENEAVPPGWLAAQMNDPWTGKEAEELWNGVQQAKSEAAAYRAAFATPEDARALKELYPGGVSEARAAAERARLLDDIDRSYFGAAGNSAEQTSAARVQLAQTLLREDPAAFREMVFAGLRALEKYAVRIGGGRNHRKDLGEAILIKENHIRLAGGISPALAAAQAAKSRVKWIEIEVTNLDELSEALPHSPDVILLDNMSPETLRRAVAMVDGRAVTEASGRISPETVAAVAATGVDLISSGWITHSAPILDLGLDIL
jgi:hypothetical protein